MADQPFDLFYLPFRPALDANGIVVPGASLAFYTTGTSTLQTVYADAALTVPLDNPVTANSAGVWPAIYIDNSLTYRVVLKNELGAVLNEADPYVPGAVGGPAGATGPADNTYTSYAAMQASDPARKSARLVGDTDTPPHADGPYNNPSKTVGGWVAQGADGISTQLPISGALIWEQQLKNAITVSVLDFIPKSLHENIRKGLLTYDCTAAFNLATGANDTHTGNDTPLKRLIDAPPGKYRIDGQVFVRRGQYVRGHGWTTTWFDYTQSTAPRGFVLGCGSSGVVDPGGLGSAISSTFHYGNASPAVDASKPDSWGVFDNMFTECGVGVRAGGTDGRITGNVFDGGDVGIDWVVGHSHRATNNLFFNVNTDMRVGPYACDIMATGNTHQYPEIASLYLVPGAVGIRNFVFSNNTCLMNAQYASHLGFIFIASEGADIQIKSNNFRNGKGFAVIYGGGTGNRYVFSDNEVDGSRTTQVYDQTTSAGGVEVSNMEAVVINNRFLNLKAASIFCGPTQATSLELRGNTFRRCTGGSTELQISGANANSGIVLDDSNVSDRAIVPAQTGVSVFAPRVATGRVTLVAGQATVALPIARTSSRVLIQRYQDGGTVGASYTVSRTPGTGFTIQAKDGVGNNQAADTSTVDWTVDLMGV